MYEFLSKFSKIDLKSEFIISLDSIIYISLEVFFKSNKKIRAHMFFDMSFAILERLNIIKS